MKLLTDELETQFKENPLMSQDGKLEEARIIAKISNKSGPGTWLITEGSQEDDDWCMFGYCHIVCWEWGYVMLSELQNLIDSGFADLELLVYKNKCTVGDYISTHVNVDTVYSEEDLIALVTKYCLTEYDTIAKITTVNKINHSCNSIAVPSLAHKNMSACFDCRKLFQDYQNTGYESICALIDVAVHREMNEIVENRCKPISYFKQLVNYELNKEFLKDAIFEKFLDLAIVIRAVVIDTDHSVGSMIMTEAVTKELGLTKEQLFSLTLEKTDYNEILIMPVEEMLQRALKQDANCVSSAEAEITMYAVTNKQYLNGSGAILSDTFKKFAKKLDSDLFLLPSSIHEWFIVIDNTTLDRETSIKDLKDIVKYANDNVLNEKEFLSNNVYMYDRITDSFSII